MWSDPITEVWLKLNQIRSGLICRIIQFPNPISSNHINVLFGLDLFRPDQVNSDLPYRICPPNQNRCRTSFLINQSNQSWFNPYFNLIWSNGVCRVCLSDQIQSDLILSDRIKSEWSDHVIRFNPILPLEIWSSLNRFNQPIWSNVGLIWCDQIQ